MYVYTQVVNVSRNRNFKKTAVFSATERGKVDVEDRGCIPSSTAVLHIAACNSGKRMQLVA